MHCVLNCTVVVIIQMAEIEIQLFFKYVHEIVNGLDKMEVIDSFGVKKNMTQ